MHGEMGLIFGSLPSCRVQPDRVAFQKVLASAMVIPSYIF